MAGFTRYYATNPGLTTLSDVESINVIDEDPPSTPLGAGSGVVCVIGEFEKGPLEVPTRLAGNADLLDTFGSLGWEVNGLPAQYPVASQSAGASYVWAGNGFINLRNKRHAGLIVVRVDNSAGSVEFRRLATLEGGAAPFDLEPGQTLIVSVNGGAAVTGTFNAAAATLDGSGGTFPTLFVGGETLELSIDGGPTLVVTFTAAEQTIGQVVARINSVAAQTIASDNAGQLRLSSAIRGYSGTIEVVGGTARATLGLPTAVTQQVMTLTVTAAGTTAAWSASFQQAISGSTVTYTANFTSDASPSIQEVRDGLYAAFLALGVPNATFSTVSTNVILVTMAANKLATSPTVTPGGGGTATFTTTTPAVRTQTEGTGNVANIDLVSQAEFSTIIGALVGVDADQAPSGNARIMGTTTPATGTIAVSVLSTATGLGFTAGVTAAAGVGGEAGTIPAGTLLRDSTTSGLWITIEDVELTEDDGGPYSVRVRPAVDNDTTPTSAASGVNTVVSSLYTGMVVTNPLQLARLTLSQMDARYAAAIDTTIDPSGVSYDINIIRSARVSDAINAAIYANALAASAGGHRVRKAVVAPPIGTSRASALGSTWPGVGQNRDQRRTYCFPGQRQRVPEIAAVGVSGGTGFRDDGMVDVPSDAFYASVRSILPPEENAGQQLTDTVYGPMPSVGLEAAYDRTLGGISLGIDDYRLFKAGGIVAPRLDRVAGMVFHSDVTSVNPSTQPALADNKRRYFGDFLADSLHDIGTAYSKKLNKPTRRQSLLATVTVFLELLKSPGNPEASRLEDYVVKAETTSTQRGAGFEIVRVAVRQYASMDFIVFRLTSGTTVSVEELAA